MLTGSRRDPYQDSPTLLTMTNSNCPAKQAATEARVSHREFRCFDRPLSFVVYTQIYPDFGLQEDEEGGASNLQILGDQNFVCFTAHSASTWHESSDS